MTQLRIGYLPILDHLTLGVALHQEELAVEPVEFPNWSTIAAALKRGEIDGAFLLFPLALELYRHEENLRLLLLGHREGQVLTARPEIQTILDLRGETVRLPHELSTHRLLLHEALQSAGLDTSDVAITFGYDDIRSAADELAAGTVDGFMLAEPMGTEARRRKIGHSLTLSGDVQPHHIDCVLVLNRRTVSDQPAACQGLVDGLVRAGGFINAYPRQAAEIGSKFLGWNASLLREALSHDRGHILYWDLLPRLEDFETLQRVAVNELHLWSDAIDLSDFIDPRFAQRAYREWVIDVRQAAKDKGHARTLPGTLQESIVQLSKRLGHPIEAIGVEYILPGKPYPTSIPHQTAIQAVSKLVLSAFCEPVVIEISEKGLKAIALVPVSDQANRVIMKLNEEEIIRLEQALHFGVRQRVPSVTDKITLEVLRDEETVSRPIRISGQAYLALNATALRFLPLLLQ